MYDLMCDKKCVCFHKLTNVQTAGEWVRGGVQNCQRIRNPQGRSLFTHRLVDFLFLLLWLASLNLLG